MSLKKKNSPSLIFEQEQILSFKMDSFRSEILRFSEDLIMRTLYQKQHSESE